MSTAMSNKPLSMDTEVSISHDFHVQQKILLFSHPLKISKPFLALDHAKAGDKPHLALRLQSDH
jgi:hypothetical protein